MSDSAGAWILGIIVSLIGMLGLFLAAKAESHEFHIAMMIVTAWSVLFVGWIIKHAFDLEAETHK